MAARAIANSPLVKTAVHGGDPNWGRLVAAAGRSGAAFVLDGARVQIGSLVLFENGRPFDELAPKAADYLMGKDFSVADAYLFTVSNWAPYFDIDLSGLADLVAFRARVAARPAVHEALKAEGLNK